MLTDADGRDWLNREWGPEKTHRTDNENHRPHTYADPLTAVLLCPAFEAYVEPRIFKADGTGSGDDSFRTSWASLTTLEEITPPVVTDEQRITFGVVCALNAVGQKEFGRWALDWLRGANRSSDDARVLEGKMIAEIMLARDPDECYGAAHAACAAVAHTLPQDVKLYAACAAHRAWADTLLSPNQMNLTEIATVCTMFPPEEIGKMLGGQ